MNNAFVIVAAEVGEDVEINKEMSKG